MRITQLQLRRFKAFEKFTLNLGPNAFLVGPNNAGKSTLIAAVRASSGMLTQARRLRPTLYERHREIPTQAHALNGEALGLVVENLRHQFRNDETSVSMTFDTGVTVTAVWPPEVANGGDDDDDDEGVEGYQHPPFFYVRNKAGVTVVQPAKVRELTEPIGVIPGLAPINRTENVLGDDYVRSHYEGRRTSQHTRNHLRLIDEAGEFDEFREFALRWLPELASLRVASRPGEGPGERELDVFVREQRDRTEKELFWSGDGLQVFVQILAHVWRLRDASVIVLDEPDLYLHADLQRRLVRLLESMDAQTITATHSPEMLAEAPADSVIWVDKSRARGVRRPNASTLQDLSAQIGSGFNLRLASALRAKVVLFVEGNDMTFLRSLAKTAGCVAVAEERGCSVIGMQGFSHWVHVEPFAWLLDEFLEGAVEVFVVLDRDFRTMEELRRVERQLEKSGVGAHVWRRKEIESYLLEPPVLARLTALPVADINDRLALVTDQMTSAVRARFLSERLEPTKTRDSRVTKIQAALDEIDRWSSDPAWRLTRYPAKEILSGLNSGLQADGLSTVSASRLARQLKAHEIDPEVVELLRQIEALL